MSRDQERTGLEIAVIGMAGRFPGAKDLHQFWDNLKNGVESITFYSDKELLEAGIDPDLLENPNYVKARGGILEDMEYFDASFFGYSAIEAELMDPQVRLFHECAWHALENAGYDSFSFEGLIGLYAGASFNLYWETLSWLSGKKEVLGDFATWLLIDRDNLCTRVSYNLNLKGPSVVVKSACSTSLAAVHMACQAILNGECDMAIAGGVSIIRLTKSGYLYQEDMIASPDGHCRAFDARAGGIIGGDGVGIVILKRLEDAIAGGDYIYAVIKGTAINNDGIRKAGYTAPSIAGQSEVISDALQVAEIEPETITYLETHGTGTVVGDPIEIEGLKIAFNTDKKGFCRIGSVKTNIGHLDAAAGVAGLVKTILALKHQLIPQSLHFQSPNPKIDLENSPFYVDTELSEWKRDGYPLRAGVSSFGIGGTNAHAVLEEAPEIEDASPARAWHLLLLSAKTGSALERASANLMQFLKNNPGINLADAAYTLQVGRRAFQYRRMLVCSNAAAAIDALSTTTSGKMYSSHLKGEKKSPIFMFSGLGAQYVNMGSDLYQTEPVFREEMDRCFKILTPLVGDNIKGILYPPAAGEAQMHLSPDINRVEIAQLAIFVLEYALARLLMKWGIKPHAMIGYSFGEYTAACLSGVFSLEDALKLIVTRGQLIARIHGGSMLSVPIPANRLKPLLSDELSIAIDNGPSCIAAGPDEKIDALEKQLKEKRYLGMKLPNSYAIHSKMMIPVLKEFEKHVARVKLHKPQIPYISNLTGTWITIREATDPAYWSKHLRETVRFADGIDKLKKEPNPVFIEIGPGRDLHALLARHKEEDPGLQAVNLIPPQLQDCADDRYLLSKIGRLWLHGVTIDWRGFYTGEKRFRIPLPTYSFDGQRYWIEGNPPRDRKAMLFSQSIPPKKNDAAEWFYIPQWNRSALPVDVDAGIPGDQRGWLLFMDESKSELGANLVKRIKKDNQGVIIVRPGSTFEVVNEREYTVNPSDVNDYNRLFRELAGSKNVPGNIVHLWCLTGNSQGKPGASVILAELDRSQDLGLYSLLNIAGAIGENGISKNIRLGVITDNMQPVTGEEELCPGKATILGPVKVIPLEYPNIKCLSIDIIDPGPDKQKRDFIIDNLPGELSADFSDYRMVAYRGTYRWIESYEPFRLNHISNKVQRLKKKGVYLLTGGFGGMGFALAENLARTLSARLILVDILDLPRKEGQDKWLASETRKKDIRLKKQKIKELEKMGAEIQIYNADVSDYPRMKEVISKAEERFGKIDGVIHTAGLIDYSGVIQKRTRQMTDTILDAKVRGALVLDELLKDHELDFMVTFSSIGNIFHKLKFGQVGYNAGHEFLDVFSYHKQKQGRLTITIDWNDWTEVGMAVRAEQGRNASNINIPGNPVGFQDILSISPVQGIDAFQRIVANDLCRVIVFTRDLGQVIAYMNHLPDQEKTFIDVPGNRESTASTGITGSLYERPQLDTAYVPPTNKTQQALTDIWQEFFGINRLGINDDFFDLGGDSLKASILISRIHKKLDVSVPMAEFFKRPTIKTLALFIVDNTGKSGYFSIDLAEKKEYHQLSSAQTRLYVLQQMNEPGIGYNTPSVSILAGNIDKTRLEDTFKRLIKRHESLRTSFHIIDEETVQRIHESHEVEFEIEYDRSLVNCQGKGEVPSPIKVERIIRNFIRPFDLSFAPLLRVGLIREEESKHILVVDMHHIISDGTSTGIFVKDFMAIYAGRELPPLKIQYKDFPRWQNSKKVIESIKHQQEYWLKEFETEIPVLNLLTDFTRPIIQGFEGRISRFEIDKKHTGALKKYALEEGVTLFMVLLAVYNVFLSKLSNQEDIVVGTPTAGRGHMDLENIIGVFINTLVLRNFIEGKNNFKQFLMKVKNRALEAFSNQDYPYEELVEKAAVPRDTGRNPLFDAMFILQNFDLPGIKIPGLTLKPYMYDQNKSLFDLTLVVFEKEETLWCIFEYSTKLFKAITIERFINYFKKIISGIIDNPAVKIMDIEIISEEEKKQVLFDFNDTNDDYPGEKTIHRLFEEQVDKTPDNIAVVFERKQLSYRTLNARANQLAGALREKGGKPDVVIGIMVKRSIDMLVGIMAILKAGGAYLPIDSEYPVKRKKYMLDNSGVNLLLINFAAGNVMEDFSSEIEVIDLRDKNIYCGERDNPQYINLGSDLLYVIYTSGSTGNPKGVMLEHRNLVNLLNFQYKHTNIDCSKILQFSTISFDASSHEIFSAFLAGGTIYLVSEDTRMNIPVLFKRIDENRIKTLFLPISFLKVIFREDDYIKLIPGCITHIQTAGEQVVISDNFRKYLRENNVSLHNHYGPSETHVVTTFTIEPQGEIPRLPSIGKPVANTRIYILNKHACLLLVGVPGELCIGGVQVGRGYLGKTDLTEQKFIPDPFKAGERLYKTGDLARWLPDGNIEFLGRIDHQVKIRGFRIELGEIETQLLNHSEIKEAIALVKEDERGDRYLCAYVVSDREFSIAELRKYLSGTLPDYMMPSYVVHLDKIPVNPNGKVDRKALPPPGTGAGCGHIYTAPGNRLEEKLTGIWSQVLGIEKMNISTDANFFVLGGHSLKAMAMTAKIHKELNVQLPLSEIFKAPTIRGLSEYIKELVEDRYVPIEPVEKKEYYQLSRAQKRLYVLKEMNNQSIAYNLPSILMLEGRVNESRFEDIFWDLIKRHESLRTSFEIIDEEPVQRIHAEVKPGIEYYDLTAKNKEDGIHYTSYIIHQFVRVFDLSETPLLRVGLIKEKESRYILMIDMHHIISDGVSLGVLIHDFMKLYEEKILPELQIQYKDYTGWQNSEVVKKKIRDQETYWLNEFSDDPPVLNLPTDFPRPTSQCFEGNILHFDLSEEETKTLNEMARSEGTTLFVVLLAIITTFLSKLSGQEDIIVGTPIAGRSHSDLEQVIGMFVNTLALRSHPSGNKTFVDFLKQLKERTLKAFENQDYPFDELVEKLSIKWDTGRNPLFDVMFTLQNILDEEPTEILNRENTGLKWTVYEYENDVALFDLTLDVVEREKLLFLLAYNTRLFKRETIEQFIINFKEIAAIVTKNRNIELNEITISHGFVDVESKICKDEESHFAF